MITPNLTLNIKTKDQEFVTTDYWWEDDDFIFITNNGEKYCYKNMYPISMKIEGLEYDSSEDLVIEAMVRYESSVNKD